MIVGQVFMNQTEWKSRKLGKLVKLSYCGAPSDGYKREAKCRRWKTEHVNWGKGRTGRKRELLEMGTLSM